VQFKALADEGERLAVEARLTALKIGTAPPAISADR
jgi:hypothetical protein